MADVAVRVALDGAVLRVVLARPQVGNAIDAALVSALLGAVDRADADPAVRCLVLLADGPSFCVGGDVRTFGVEAETEAGVEAGAEPGAGAGAGAGAGPAATVGALAAALHAALRRIARCRVPIVVGAQGWLAGAGIALACLGDVIVLGASSRLRPAYLSLGLSPDGGVSWLLARALGPARALDLLLTDGVLTAEQALAAGLVSRVVDDAAVASTAGEVAARIADGPAGAVARTRSLVRAALDTGLDSHLDAEAAAIAACAGEPDGVEGVRAFLARRPPRFGRL